MATDAQWSAIQATLPTRARVAARQKRALTDDLYIIQYSTDTCAVKIGRAYNVENRRRQLEGGQNFFVRVLASFSGDGHLETEVHEHIAVFRSTSGAGREWFNITYEQAVQTIRFVQSHHTAC